ncbi:hypothetical protein C1645_749394 [Glomus cerebriforme]|uniref:Uncharacterized protein n=1 Tax=Glomus cerebriforme TaxID=658196 RepID=A0A397TUP0_9GLOM|nr:hypothetical protein C1645_749394 [Glomus cerebriforme]
MVDWLDADFSEQSDSSDEEFVFHEEDAAEDTSGSSEEEASDVDHSTVANQNTPQHTNGYHKINGNSAATSQYATPIHTPLANGNGHGLDESSYTNGKIGANRHHPHLYNPYGRTSPRRSNGERDGDELVCDYNSRSGAILENLPNHPLREFRMPFNIFTSDFNTFHDEQGSLVKKLRETEHEMLQINTKLEEEIEIVKDECNDLKAEYRDICDENKQIREYIEEMHSFLLPYFNNILRADGDNGGNEADVKDMDIDKTNSGDDNEEKDDETEDELDEVIIGPFLIELYRQQQQQQQQVKQEQEQLQEQKELERQQEHHQEQKELEQQQEQHQEQKKPEQQQEQQQGQQESEQQEKQEQKQ